MGLRLVIMGGPGAGKGTQAEKIAQTLQIPHISTGDILREEIKQETELGKEVQAQIEAGRLAPDEMVCKIVDKRLAKPDCGGGYILDGFPRTCPQAGCLDEMLQKRGDSLDLVVNIVVEDDEIVRRLSARRLCPVCGAIYNLRFKAPKKDNRCDNPACDGAELYQRTDDNEATIRERLRVYHKESEPLLAFYGEQGKLKDVPGSEGTPSDVFVKIEKLINANKPACTK